MAWRGRIAAIALASASITACAAASLDVLRPVPGEVRSVSLSVRDATRGEMSAEQLEAFRATIATELRHAGIIVDPRSRQKGTVQLVGAVERFDPGFRALRFVSRYGFGTGSLATSWKVQDRGSNVAAACRIEGSVSMGTFGGSFAEVQDEAGRALARFLMGDLQ